MKHSALTLGRILRWCIHTFLVAIICFLDLRMAGAQDLLMNGYCRFEEHNCWSAIDPNPDLLTEDGEIVPWNGETLRKITDERVEWYFASEGEGFPGETSQKIISGVVADGVTQIMLVMMGVTSRHSVTLEITSATDGSDGLLSLPEGATGTVEENGTRLRLEYALPFCAEGVGGYIYCGEEGFTKFGLYSAIYTPPPDFDKHYQHIAETTRKVTIQLHDADRHPTQAYPANIEIDLHRPPVLCVHGIWANPGVCGKLTSTLNEQHFNGYRAGYVSENAESFDPALGFTGPPRAFLTAVDAVRTIYRQKKVAITQIDVVGESMGGLVVRASTKLKGREYKRKENFGKGDIRRLIAVGAPNFGARIANFLLDKGDCARQMMRDSGLDPDKGGFADLAVGSRGQKHLNLTDSFEVPTHTIVGIRPPNMDNIQKDINVLYEHFCHEELPPLQDIHGEDHDVIVGESLQKGFSVFPATSVFSGLVHSPGTWLLTCASIFRLETPCDAPKSAAEIDNPDVQERIVTLLKSSSDSGLFWPEPSQ